METVLKNLEQLILQHPEKCYFNEPVSLATIQRVELLLGIDLPASYKVFLQAHNGGVICPDALVAVARRSGIEALEQEVIRIFSIEELYDQYRYRAEDGWKMDAFRMSVYPVVPVCSAPNGEILVFPQPLIDGEAPLFDAFHEEPCKEWGMSAKSFGAFLQAYITSGGAMKTIPEDNAPLFGDFFPDDDWRELPADTDDPDKKILYWSEMLKFRPREERAYIELGNAYREKGDFHSALFYLNRMEKRGTDDPFLYYSISQCYAELGQLDAAIEAIDTAVENYIGGTLLVERGELLFMQGKVDEAINSCLAAIQEFPEESYGYIIISKMYGKVGQLNTALLYSQKAVQMEPKSVLALSIYADILYKKELLEEAVEICNRAIALDPAFLSSFITREMAHRKLGHLAAAERDMERINELLDRENS